MVLSDGQNADSMLMHRLASFRGLHGWSQRKLAERSGIAKSTIAAIESGKAKNVTVETLRRLTVALDASPNSLLGYGEETGNHNYTVTVIGGPEGARQCKCGRCSMVFLIEHVHLLGECIATANEAGASRGYLAIEHRVSVAVIDALLTDEYARRARRRP